MDKQNNDGQTPPLSPQDDILKTAATMVPGDSAEPVPSEPSEPAAGPSDDVPSDASSESSEPAAEPSDDVPSDASSESSEPTGDASGKSTEDAPDEALETAVTMVAPAASETAPKPASDAEPADEKKPEETSPADTKPATQEATAAGAETKKTESDDDRTAVLSKPPQPSKLVKGILQPGEMLGKYRIEKRLGKGGMGEVYLGKHEQLGILRAIKVLPADLARKNSQFFTRFLREAKTACEIRHSNVVNVMDVGTDAERGLSYIVMEFVDGGDVRGLLKSSGHLTVDQALVIVEAVASALAAASEYGIVHRDIKPDNIMLTKRGEVKLADLGIAKSGGDDDIQLTKTNVMMGTPAYLSPEQAKDAKHVDVRADIYSLGATFFEMVTGRIPYEGHSVYDILSKLHTAPVPDPCDFNADIPPEIGKIIMTMMAKKPENRYQSAAELLEVLSRSRAHQKTALEAQKIIREAIQTAYGADAVPTTTTTVVRRRRRGLYRKIGIAAAGAAVFGLVLFLALRHRTASPAVQPPAAPQEVVATPVPGVPAQEPAPVRYAATFQVEPAGTEVTVRDDSGKEFAPASRSGNEIGFSLPPDTYLYTARCDGFITESGSMNLRQPRRFQIALAPSRLTVNTLPGAGVKVSIGGRTVADDKADDKGQFSLSGLKSGIYVVEAVMAGRKPRREETAFAGDGVAALDFRLDPLVSSVKLHRLNFSVTPQDAAVQLFDDKGSAIAATSKIGSVRSYELPAGFYLYKISRPGYADAEGKCQVSENTDIPAVTLQPFLLTVSSNPGAKLELLSNSLPVAAQTADKSGKAVFSGIPAGEYLLRGEMTGCLPQSKRVTVKPASHTEAALDLPRELWDFQIFGPEGCHVTVTSGARKVYTGVLSDTPAKLRLPAGEYQADFSLSGRAGRKIPFRLPDDRRITARLERNQFNLTLHVVPVKVQADLTREDGSVAPLRAHISGSHTFSALAPGNWQLLLTAPGYEDHREAFTIAGDDEDRHITMKRVRLSGGDAGGLTIRSVTTGDPKLDQYIVQNGVEVRLKDDSSPWQAVRFPYTFKNLKAGKYVVLFRLPAKQIKGQESEEITVEAGRIAEYNMFLVTF